MLVTIHIGHLSLIIDNFDMAYSILKASKSQLLLP